jgi:hypothetical protein
VNYQQLFTRKNFFDAFIIISYGVLVWIGKHNHEMWRDEIHGPLISKSSSSLTKLMTHLKYEGHPPLPYLLYSMGHLFNWPPNFLSLLFFSIGILAITFMVRLNIFTPLQKLLLLSNYYFLYEFGIFNRIYIFLMLLLMLQWFFIIRNKKFAVLSVTLLGIITHVQVIPILFIGYLYFIHKNIKNWKGFILLLIAILICICLTINFCEPPKDSWFHINTDYKSNSFIRLLENSWQSFTYGFAFVQAGGDSYWNKSMIPLGTIFNIIGYLFYTWFAFTLKRKNLLYFIPLTVAYLILFSVVDFWSIRHFSFSFLTFFVAYIINQNNDPTHTIKWPFTILLMLWSFNGIKAFALEMQHTFSNSHNIVNAVNKYPKLNICSNNGPATEAITFFTNRKVYSLDADTVYNFYIWQNRNTPDLKNDSVLYKYANKQDSFLYIHSLELDLQSFTNKKNKLKKHFDIQQIWEGQPSVIRDENFIIFLFKSKTEATKPLK